MHNTLAIPTLTSNTSIFTVATVMIANWIAGTSNKSAFIPSALHIVQPDGSISLAKEGKWEGSRSWGRVEHLCKHVCEPELLYTPVSGWNILQFMYNNHKNIANQILPVGENPSCLQTTSASTLSQSSSHTVPHTAL